MTTLSQRGARAFAVLCLCTAVTACGGVDGGPLLRANEPTGTIRIMNETSYTIDAANISDCNNFTYGFNRIERGQGIPPGQYRDFTVSAGCWDVAAGAIGVGDNRQRLQVQAGGISQYTMTN